MDTNIKTQVEDIPQKFYSLERCVYSRLLVINSMIRKSRNKVSEDEFNHYKEIRKKTDQLLSKVRLAINKDKNNRESYYELSRIYLNE